MYFRNSIYIFLSISIFLNNCMVGPDYKKPEIAEKSRWNVKHPRILTKDYDYTNWWRQFNDPTLNKLIELGQKQNLSLKMAGLKIFEAKAQVGIAKGNLYPQSQSADLGYTHFEGKQRSINGIPFDPDGDNFNSGVTVMWELDLWGKVRRGVDSAKAYVEHSIANYDDVKVSLTGQIAEVYFILCSLKMQLDLAQKNLSLVNRKYQISSVQNQYGKEPAFDKVMGRESYKQSQSNIPKLNTEIKRLENTLAFLLSIKPSEIQAILYQYKESMLLPEAPNNIMIDIPANLLRRRPDIRKAEYEALVQCQNIGIAKADLYPSFSLMGFMGLSGNSIDELVTSGNFAALIAPRISWNFFAYGRIRNKIRVEDAKFQGSLENYKNTVLNAYKEVENALNIYIYSLSQEQFYNESLDKSVRLFQLAETRFSAGADNSLNRIGSNQKIIHNQMEIIKIRENKLKSIIALYKALGGGWENRTDSNILSEKTIKEMKDRTDWGDYLPESKKDTNKETENIIESNDEY